MLGRKLSALFFVFLMLNLNMVIPAVSYAAAEETCSCHLDSADHRCHCEDGCNTCGMHKGQGSEDLQHSAKASPVFKGRTCSASPERHDDTLPIIGLAFLPVESYHVDPARDISGLAVFSDGRLSSRTIVPSERPPIA